MFIEGGGDGSWNSPSPVPRKFTSQMHPGWACFMLAWFSGMFTMATMIYIMIHADWGFWPGAVIAIVLFILGGRKAENLIDRK